MSKQKPSPLAKRLRKGVSQDPGKMRNLLVEAASAIEAANREIEQARIILRSIEWMGPGARTKEECGPLKGERCPFCHHVKEIGHKPTCKLAWFAACEGSR